MADSATQARPASPSKHPAAKRAKWPGRKPKGSAPVTAPKTPDQPDPDHVLTWRQRKILRTIRASVRERGYPPSMREIGDAVGLTTTSSVSYQLSTLQRKGYLHRDVGLPRTMEVRLPGRPPVRPAGSVAGSTRAEAEPADDIPSQEAAYVPLIGQIAANGLILADRWGAGRVPAAQAGGRRGHAVPAQDGR